MKRSWAELVDAAMDAAVVPGFTNLGYAIRRRLADGEALRRMDGRVVLVTGATGGLGRAAALALARLGAEVIVVSRSDTKVDALVTEIAEAGGSASGVVADLSLVSEVRRVAEQVENRTLHVLINNVGVLLPERSVTKEGIEATLATDLLGHFVLTEALIPTLQRSAPARIVNVTSGGMYTQRIHLRDLQNERDYRGSVAYARAKRGQVILTEVWAARLEGTGVTVHAVHPGWADTAGVRESLPTFRKMTRPLLRTAEQGADTIVWIASADAEAIGTGGLWHDRARRPKHRFERTRESGDERRGLVEELKRLADEVAAN